MNDKTKICVVGAGYWGINIIRNIYQLGNLGSVVEINKDLHKNINQIAPNVRIIEDYDLALKDNDIDGIMIATPSIMHGKMVKKALEFKKNVFVEKPLCLELKEGNEIAKIADREKLKVMVGHLLLYHPAFLALKREISNSSIGNLRYIYSNRLSLGKLRREEDVLWSFAPHDISMILSILNDKPKTVEAFGGSYLQSNVKDTSITMLQFQNNIKAHIFVSWLHPYKDQRLIVIGDKGMIVFADVLNNENKLMLYQHKAGWQENIPVIEKSSGIPIEYDKTAEPLHLECTNFIDWIEGGKEPPSNIQEGLRVLDVLNQAKKSLDRL